MCSVKSRASGACTDIWKDLWLKQPRWKGCELCLELAWSAEHCQSTVSSVPLVPIIKMVRPFYLFMSVSFELWVYWYAKGKKNKHMFICSVNLFSQSTLSDLSESFRHNYNLSVIHCRKVSIFSRRNITVPERKRKKGGKRKEICNQQIKAVVTDIRRHPVDLQCLHSAT